MMAQSLIIAAFSNSIEQMRRKQGAKISSYSQPFLFACDYDEGDLCSGKEII